MTSRLLLGDCLIRLRELPADSVDSVVTDPPYGLSEEADIEEVLRCWLAGERYEHKKAGFMGAAWDNYVPGPDIWREVYRVLKPGGYLLSFAGSRTIDLMGMSIRLAGFEIRDTVAWLYGSGFPKSHDVSKAIDKAAGAEREVVRARSDGDGNSGRLLGEEKGGGGVTWQADFNEPAPATPDAKKWEGYGTALKPAHEPIVVARKPFKGTVAANVLEYGTGAINIDGCRIEWDEKGQLGDTKRRQSPRTDITGGSYYATGSEAGGFVGEKQSPSGRWPANVILDEEAARLLDEQTGNLGKSSGGKGKLSGRFDNPGIYGTFSNENVGANAGGLGDSGGASRFFYVAKASKKERNAGLIENLPRTKNERKRWQQDMASRWAPRAKSKHPTVKPIALMRYLCRLVTQPGGTVLDPFAGSGSTGCAAVLEGFDFIGIEKDAESVEIAKARIAHWEIVKPQNHQD